MEMFRPGLTVVACGYGTKPVSTITPGTVPAGMDATRVLSAMHMASQDGDKRNEFDLNGSTACTLPK